MRVIAADSRCLVYPIEGTLPVKSLYKKQRFFIHEGHEPWHLRSRRGKCEHEGRPFKNLCVLRSQALEQGGSKWSSCF